MGRFVDPKRMRRVELGPCDCPGSPHEADWARIRAELSAHEIVRQAEAIGEDLADVWAEFVKEWNLTDASGQVVPITGPALLSMMAPTLGAISDAIADVVAESGRPLPNASGAPSASGSPGSAPSTPTLPTAS